MTAERAGRGGGWGGQGLQYTFVCRECGHQAVLENAASRALSGFAGLLFLAAAVVALLLMPAPAGLVLGLVGGALGIWGAYAGFLQVGRQYPVTGHEDGAPRDVEIEAYLYLTEGERDRGRKWERRVGRMIYAILVATALFLLYAALAEADSEPLSIESCNRHSSQIAQKECLGELLGMLENALMQETGRAREHWHGAEAQKAFDAAQEAWGLYLDQECAAAFAMVAPGSDASAAETRCRIELINRRLRVLSRPGY